MVTSGPLLATKLYSPTPRRGLVARPRLRDCLSHGADARLTLVSAPAGFGKTTLLAEWLAAAAAEGRAAAWLSLDPGDNRPAAFWAYVIAALQTAAPAVGADALALLQAPQPPPIETILTTLLNDLGDLTRDILLVLDDYHAIEAPDIHDGLLYLLDHLPPRVHLVIASRADPPLPLARLRARGELVEIRAADLRFTPGEAAAYLNEVMGLGLPAGDVSALEERTEGWIAALQLAALSIQGRDDAAAFIRTFAGDDRFVVDYLAEEVLQRQPEPVRQFLLGTSVLDRLTGPLCEAVTGASGGRAMLEALDRGNLFVVPLDDRRRWYRYHHLFADVLRAHLLDEQPDRVPELHRRASTWYAAHDEPAEAVRHALAARDFAAAADLIERAIPALRRERQEATLLSWLGALPDAVLRARPVLSAVYGSALLVSGEVAGVEPRLRDAERWLDTTRDSGAQPGALSPEMVVVDEEAFRQLPGSIAVWRSGLALALGDGDKAAAQARRALDLLPDDDHLGRGAAAGLLGLVYWGRGDLDSAHRLYAECLANLQRAGHVADTLGSALAIADIRLAQGRLHDARRTYEEALQRIAEQGTPVPRGTADMYAGLSELACECGDLDAARLHLARCEELGEHTGLPQHPYRRRVAAARIREAEGDLDGAVDLLEEAERRYVADFFPNVRPVAALKARVWIAQGRLGEAQGWARAQGLSADDDLSYLRELEHVTLARLLLAQARHARADSAWRVLPGFLERLLHAAEGGQRVGSTIEILVLQALAHHARGDLPAALRPLERALALAEPEGYVRVFVDEGPPMVALLEAARARGITLPYVQRLLAGFAGLDGATPIRQALAEPLSDRELDVLRLLATDLDGPEIARELVVSLNTLRTHTRHVYEKLGVSSRRAAVRRAEELGLLSRPRRT